MRPHMRPHEVRPGVKRREMPSFPACGDSTYFVKNRHAFTKPVCKEHFVKNARLTQSCLCLLMCFALCGCLVPDKYKATLTLSNTAYSVEFIGKMHMAASYSDTYKQGTDNPKQLAASIMREFERVIRERTDKVETLALDDHSFGTQFEYYSPYYLPEATGMFAFTVVGDTLTVVSRPVSSNEMELIKKNNLTSKGSLCIRTSSATILESNADKSATLIDMCNRWELNDLERPIKFVVRFAKPVPMTPQTYQDMKNAPKGRQK
jgi:hypothetical protein